MSLNKVSAVVSPEQEAQTLKLIKDARTGLDFLVSLSSKERIKMAKLSRGKVDFIDTSMKHIQSKPEYLPSYVSLEEFVKDVDLQNSLKRILTEVDAFKDRLEDTIMVAESEAYRTSRLFYKAVKAAGREGAEDAERIVKDLAYHFKSQGSSKHSKGSGLEEEETADSVEKVTQP